MTKLCKLLKSYKKNILFLDDCSEHYTYKDLTELADSPEFRLAKGKLVFCLLENNIHSLIGYLALLVGGAIPLPLSKNIAYPFLKKYLECLRPSFIWLSDERSNDVEKISVEKNIFNYQLAYLGVRDYDIHKSLALVLPTSGTTGGIKFVRLSQLNWISNALSIANYLNLTPKDNPVTILPPHYSYGLSIIHSHLLVGAKILVTNKTLFHNKFWQFFDENEATSFSGVPYHFEMLRKIGFKRLEQGNLKKVCQAGGAMSNQLAKELAEFFSERNIKFFMMYGQTEASPRISYLSPGKAVSKPRSIGKAIPQGKLWLEDDKGNEINDPEVIGNLIYKGQMYSWDMLTLSLIYVTAIKNKGFCILVI